MSAILSLYTVTYNTSYNLHGGYHYKYLLNTVAKKFGELSVIHQLMYDIASAWVYPLAKLILISLPNAH